MRGLDKIENGHIQSANARLRDYDKQILNIINEAGETNPALKNQIIENHDVNLAMHRLKNMGYIKMDEEKNYKITEKGKQTLEGK